MTHFLLLTKPHLLKFPKIAPPSEDQSTHKPLLGGAKMVRGSLCSNHRKKTSVPTGQIYFYKLKPPLDVKGFSNCMADRKNTSGSCSHNTKIIN